MKEPIYVSFYTPDYAEQADRLLLSLKRWDLPNHVQEVPDLGTWVKNCAHKPEFILSMMQRFPGRPIVWIDADGEVVGRPDFMRMYPSMCDIARCKYKWWNGKTEVLSGTLYFGPTAGAEHLLKSWQVQGQFQPDSWDQHTLEAVLDLTTASVFELPVEYCWIVDLHREQHPNGVPVVQHYQHSRVTRTKGL